MHPLPTWNDTTIQRACSLRDAKQTPGIAAIDMRISPDVDYEIRITPNQHVTSNSLWMSQWKSIAQNIYKSSLTAHTDITPSAHTTHPVLKAYHKSMNADCNHMRYDDATGVLTIEHVAEGTENRILAAVIDNAGRHYFQENPSAERHQVLPPHQAQIAVKTLNVEQAMAVRAGARICNAIG